MSGDTTAAPGGESGGGSASGGGSTDAFLGSDSLSAGELAYFSSGGSDVSGIGEGAQGATQTETPAGGEAAPALGGRDPAGQTPAPGQGSPEGAAAGQGQAAGAETAEDPEPGEIVLDETGRPHSTANGRFVPLTALKNERTARQKLRSELEQREAALAETRQREAALLERLRILSDGGAPKPATPAAGEQSGQAAAPDDSVLVNPDDDVFGAIAQLQRLLKHAEQKAEGKVEEARRQAAETQEALAADQFQRRYYQDVLTFAKAEPSFVKAYEHLRKARGAELAVFGYEGDKLQQQLITEERQIVASAYAQGKSPAAVIFEIAKHRGFSAPAPTPTPTLTAQVPGGQNAAQAAQQASAMEAVANAEKAQRAAATLSGGGSSGADATPTAEALLAMTDEQFEAALAKHGDKILKAMGK